MPSVYSFSRPRDWPSSTVTTPSLPTLSMTSAIMSPTSGSAAEIVAMAAISSRESIGRDCFLISATTASTAFSMPMRISIGFAPAVTLRMPSVIIAWPRTTAVVVPSPATSSVLVATSLRSCAPIFSKGSSSSMSRAMVTPSLVIVGAPNFLSSTTFRPLGPIVTLTASARRSTPRLRDRRAVSSKTSCLAKCVFLRYLRPSGLRPRPICVRVGLDLDLDDCQDVLLADDEEFLTVDLEIRARVFRIENPVAFLDVHLLACAVIEGLARSDCQDGSLLRLFLGRVRQDDSALGDFLAGARLDDDAITEGLELLSAHSGTCHRAVPREGGELAPAVATPGCGVFDADGPARTLFSDRCPRSGPTPRSPSHHLGRTRRGCSAIAAATPDRPISTLPLRVLTAYRRRYGMSSTGNVVAADGEIIRLLTNPVLRWRN